MSLHTTDASQVAIITGATAGIGRDLAHHLHGLGYRLGLAGRNVDKGRELVDALDSAHESVIFVQCDVSSYESQVNLFQTVWHRWQRLDVLIANAGTIDAFSPYSLTRRSEAVTNPPPAPDLTCTETNYKGPIYGTVLATHYMRHSNKINKINKNNGSNDNDSTDDNQSGGGKIIITSSTMAFQPCATFPEYSATKAAQVGWARAAASVLMEKDGISINVVMPNGYDTGIIPNFAAMFLEEHMVTKETLLSAYDEFLVRDPGNKKTGLVVETCHDKLIFHDRPAVLSGEMGERNCAVFEPLFQALHGEVSNTPRAVKDLPDHETGWWR